VHDNPKSEDHFATSEIRMGQIADLQNQPKQAITYFQAALAAALKAADDPQYDDDLWATYENLAGEQDGNAHDYPDAHQTYANEMQVLVMDLGKSPDDTTTNRLKAEQADTYGNLAWSELLTKDYAQALSDAQAGINTDPKEDWVNVNLAHAYLFTGQLSQAEKIYFDNPNRVLAENGETFAVTVLGDFKTFRGMKMVAPGMDTVQQTLVQMQKSAAAPAKPPTPAKPTAPAK
jgi:tetratricopeptide (TPR) repeat protein